MSVISAPLPRATRDQVFGLDKATAYPLFVYLALLAAILGNGGQLLADPDSQWHVAIGHSILASWSLPTVDAWSHTFAGEPWIAKEWLSQILFASAHQIAGWPGVAVMTALILIAPIAWLLAFLLQRLDARIALLALLLTILPLQWQLLARPHIFSHLLLIGWLVGCLGAVERGRGPPLALALVMTLWANMHASFLIGIVLAALLGLEALLRAAPADRPRLVRDWGIFGIVSLACTTITPYGWTPLIVALSVFREQEAVLYINEWAPLDVFGGGWPALGGFVVAAAALAAMARSPRRAAIRAVIIILCAAMALEHTRFTSLFAIVALLVLADPLAAVRPALAALPAPAGRRSTHRALAFSVLAAAAISFTALRAPVEPPATVFPQAALTAAREAGLTDRPVLNDYHFGGFLIGQGVPTFIDGRSDQLFVNGFMHAYMAALKEPTPHALSAIAERYGTGWALVIPGARSSIQLACSLGWRRIHVDAQAEVWARMRNGSNESEPLPLLGLSNAERQASNRPLPAPGEAKRTG